MNISGPAAVAKPEMLFYAPGDLTVTILPLFAFDFTQWKSVALFLIFFLTLGFLCVKHETFTVNIVLEVFGYQFYRCDLEDEDGNGITWMIISRTDLKGCVGDSVYLRPLNNECRLNASTR